MKKIMKMEDIGEVKKKLENIVQGQNITCNVFDKTLSNFGVKQFDPINEEFNPAIHEATMMIR